VSVAGNAAGADLELLDEDLDPPGPLPHRDVHGRLRLAEHDARAAGDGGQPAGELQRAAGAARRQQHHLPVRQHRREQRGVGRVLRRVGAEDDEIGAPDGAVERRLEARPTAARDDPADELDAAPLGVRREAAAAGRGPGDIDAQQRQVPGRRGRHALVPDDAHARAPGAGTVARDGRTRPEQPSARRRPARGPGRGRAPAGRSRARAAARPWRPARRRPGRRRAPRRRRRSRRPRSVGCRPAPVGAGARPGRCRRRPAGSPRRPRAGAG
jgi:hypothetical protein